MYWLVLSVLLGASRGEPVTWTVFPTQGAFVSPPIGLGPNGGLIKANLSLNNVHGLSVVSVLSGAQLDLWRKSIQAEADADTLPFEPNAYVSTFTKDFRGKTEIVLELSNPVPQQYFFVVNLPFDEATDETNSKTGQLSVDWTQADGNRLQFQFFGLSAALEVSFNLVLVSVVSYVVYLAFHPKQITRLHLTHSFVLTYALAFLAVWMNAVELEQTRGDRTSWYSKWLPSMMEKGFDILEVLTYVLTALGWMTVRSSLLEGEIRMMTMGALISFLLGLAEIECGDDAVECGSFTSARMIIHMFGYLTAIVAFNYHLASLTAFLRESSVASVDTGKMYFRLSQFWWLRFVFLLFIVQPTLAVVIRTDILNWNDEWIFVGFFWLTKIALLVCVAAIFRPRRFRMKLIDLAIRERRRTEEARLQARYLSGEAFVL